MPSSETKDPKDLLKCFHCGDEVTREMAIWSDEKAFCCQGCETVYQLISGSDLTKFYELEKAPGIKGETADREFEALDHPGLREKLIRFEGNGISTVMLKLPAIHCSSCIYLLENLKKIEPKIVSVQVDFGKKEALISWRSEEFPLSGLAALLTKIGYRPLITTDEQKEVSKTGRMLLFKLVVAGFCFGNIMLLSFPEYLGIDDLSEKFVRIFGWLNLGLSIPVVLFSGSGYLKSAWKAIRSGVSNIDIPIAIGILTLFGRSAYEIISGTGAGFMDSLAGLVFFLLIGKWIQDKTYEGLSFETNLKSFLPLTAIRLNGKEEERILVGEIQKGDRLLVRNRDLIPTDSALEKGDARMDYSFISGESDLVPVKTGDLLYAGGMHHGSPLQVTALKPVDQSYLTSLWSQEKFRKKDGAPLSKLSARLSRWFTLAVILIAFGTLAFWLIEDPDKALGAFTAVLIIACPCAIALSFPFGLGVGRSRLAKAGLFLKYPGMIEDLSRTDEIVFDKTGTLTKSGSSGVHFSGEALNVAEWALVKTLCSGSNHPMSRKIHSFTLDMELDDLQMENFSELVGQGVSGLIDGHEVKLGRFTESKGGRGTDLWIDGKLRGRFHVDLDFRDGLAPLLDQLSKGYKLHLLSGDHPVDLGELSGYFQKDRIHFQQSPEDKLNYIEALKAKGKHVLMIGDGLNDAGALAISDVGIAVRDSAFHFSPSSDGILDSQKLPKTSEMMDYAGKIMKIIRISLMISLSYNLVGMWFAIQALLSPLIAAILMPLSSVSVVAFVTLMASFFGKNDRDSKR